MRIIARCTVKIYWDIYILYHGEKRTLKHSLKIDEIISTCVSIYKVTHCLKIIQGTPGNYLTYKNSRFTRLSNTSAHYKINLLFLSVHYNRIYCSDHGLLFLLCIYDFCPQNRVLFQTRLYSND